MGKMSAQTRTLSAIQQHASIYTSKQRSTQVSPYFAIYGVHPGSSADPKVDDFEIENSEETLQRRADLLAKVHAKVHENILIAQGRQKLQYETKQRHNVKSFDVKEGDEVLVAVNKKAVKLGNAMNERWAGPFKVHDSQRSVQIG